MNVAIFVTGCNRGFGFAITELLIGKYQKDLSIKSLDIYLISRNGIASKALSTAESKVKLIDYKVDFLLDDELQKISRLIMELPGEYYDQVQLFSNAGILSKLGLAHQVDIDSIAHATKINYYAPVVIASAVLERFKSSSKIVLVNITSLAAIQAFKGWSTYCSTKAAASLFFKCIASENDPKRVKVLNYAPGPLDTQMQNDIRNGMIGDVFKKDRDFWIMMKETNGLIDPNESARVLLEIVEQDKFESGSHIDYYDVLKK